MFTANLNNIGVVTIVNIEPTGNNNILVSYVDSAKNLKVTMYNFDPRSAGSVTIGTNATSAINI